ncbi:MAG: hypothetical protein M3R08_05665 [Bacteroidota bacterium]|nr:hypothetical protein [Bacteroidota bacterium]
MRSSCRSIVFFLVLTACSGGGDQWQEVPGTSNAGFSLKMPIQAGMKQDAIQLDGQAIVTNDAICIDSAVVFVSSHFAIPERVASMEHGDRTEYVWNAVKQWRNWQQATPINDLPEPYTGSINDLYNGWLGFPDGTRMAFLLHVNDSMGIMLNAGVPGQFWGTPRQARVEKYFNSFEIEDDRTARL